MSVVRPKTSSTKPKSSTDGWRKQYRSSKYNKVLAERNEDVVSVGAWVEEGYAFEKHPCDVAVQTEALQAEKQRETEENLKRFQTEVRRRLAKRAGLLKKRPESYTEQMSGDGLRDVRHKLAACCLIPPEEPAADISQDERNFSPSEHHGQDPSDILKVSTEEDLFSDEEPEHGKVLFFRSRHENSQFLKDCEMSWLDPVETKTDWVVKSKPGSSHVYWYQKDKEKENKLRQSQFLIHRRMTMSLERDQVKEKTQQKRHLSRSAGIKAEKEKARFEEEKRLNRIQQIVEAKERMRERELLIVKQLRIEEQERIDQLLRMKRRDKKIESSRYLEAFRAQMKERASRSKMELPPLCFCASSFWDTHPDTCANNCVFYKNPKVYMKTIHSTVMNLNLH